MNDEPESKEADTNGHITSLSVLRTHRRLGMANRLMGYAHNAMETAQDCAFVSLHVRVSNRAALGLYRDRLKYDVSEVSVGYYADGEDAYEMKKTLTPRAAAMAA
jgi:N-alpha-acetyltransferase 10/11